MGHKIQRKTYRLRFADGSSLDGATITLGSLSLAQVEDMNFDETDPQAEEKAQAQFQLMADKLVAWDLEEEDGSPIPATLKGIKSLEIGMVFEIIRAWTRVQTEVAPPLPAGSASGVTSALEASIPMTPIDSSPSPAS